MSKQIWKTYVFEIEYSQRNNINSDENKIYQHSTW